MSTISNPPAAAGNRGAGVPRVIVATTALLTFISFWRAAAIVLNDLASSAYYAGGEAEAYIGKTAPWFILAIMLFSYAVRAVYVESCSMFVRGGVYRAVKSALGGTLAKFSVSALMFDYVLTGPISGVAAGQYLAGLISELLVYMHISGPLAPVSISIISAGFAVVVTAYFWWENTKGVSESSEKALHIMKLVTVMVVMLIVWCTYTVIVRHSSLPPWPYPRNLRLGPSALGWLAHSSLPHTFGIIAIFIALGHSVIPLNHSFQKAVAACVHVPLFEGIAHHVALGRAGAAQRVVAPARVGHDGEQHGAVGRNQFRASGEVNIALLLNRILGAVAVRVVVRVVK